MNVRATRFPLFDSLRAIAALAVLGAHAAVFAGLETSAGTTLGRYAARLDAGVAVFFVISGFLLYRPFVRARLQGTAAPATGPYAWRRFLRIVPAYWVALTLITLLFGTDGDVFGWPGIARYYGVAQAYSSASFAGGLTQAWSLTVEVAFYAFLPLWAAAMRLILGRRGFRAEMTALAILFAAGILYKIAVLAGGDANQVAITPRLVSLPAYFDHFALGMMLAATSVWVEEHRRLPRGLGWIDRLPSLSWLVALVAFWAVSTQIGLNGRFLEPFSSTNYMERHLLYALFAVGLVAPAVFGDQTRGMTRRVLALRPLLWLGLVSYGIFLWNLALLDRLSHWGFGDLPLGNTFAGWCIAGLAVTAPVAALSYYLVERPALSLKGLFPDGSLRRRGEAIEEPAPVTALARPAD
ncbi:MAG TPA: acyltransferase [Thermoleophilaceae bacterium]|nr:acyltransferase [Thermoleophilaceae bacterium]